MQHIGACGHRTGDHGSGVGDARQDGRVQLIDLPVPDSAAAVAAREVAQATSKPASTATAAMRSGLAERIVTNPLDADERSRHRTGRPHRPRH
jgi:hypothetical protein